MEVHRSGAAAAGEGSMFEDRIDAGRRLGEALAAAGVGGDSTVVLGIPRGGVVVAAEVARALGAPLDVVVPHKLRAPPQPELAIGGVTLDGTIVLDDYLRRMLRVTEEYLSGEIETQRAEIARRLRAYRGTAAELDPTGVVCVVVDDGVATGATAEAACRSLRSRGAARVVLAVPVGPAQACEKLREAADDVVCLHTPRDFVAVGRWYERFDQVSDDEVLAALRSEGYHPARESRLRNR